MQLMNSKYSKPLWWSILLDKQIINIEKNKED